MRFIRENFRLLALLAVAGLNYLISGTPAPDGTESFFEYVFQNFAFTLGMVFPLLAGYIGERRFINIDQNQTVTSIAAIITVLLPMWIPGTDWTSLLDTINVFASTGQLTFGAVLAVLANYFSDIRIGRPVDAAFKNNSFANPNVYRFRDLPEILIWGRKLY